MKSHIRIKITGEITSNFKFDGKTRTVTINKDGVDYEFLEDEWEAVNRYSAYAQLKEWYGDEDHIGEEGKGRHKAKGGQEIILWATDSEALYGDLAEKFNKVYDDPKNFYRYEVQESFAPYSDPMVFEYVPSGKFKEVK